MTKRTTLPNISDRCRFATIALDAYIVAKGQQAETSDLRDLMTDLLHLGLTQGRDMPEELRLMRSAFEMELKAFGH